MKKKWKSPKIHEIGSLISTTQKGGENGGDKVGGKPNSSKFEPMAKKGIVS